jgi:prepilin-type N-terminal cleavage/methylation domain-containing protein
MKRLPPRSQPAGFTLVELLIVMAIIAVLVATAVAGYRHARMRGAEAAAVAALDAINQAQFAFFQTCGDQKYAPTLTSLGVPVPGGTAFLSADLTAADQISKSGYLIQMAGTQVPDVGQACNGATPAAAYQATADPALAGTTGSRFFGTNADRVIYEDAATFTGNMPEMGAASHGTEIPTK